MYQDRLELKQEMSRSVYIQRLERPTGLPWNPFGGGGLGLTAEERGVYREVFEFQYMGAGQFEHGAIPAALNFLQREARKGKVISGEHQNVQYISPTTYEPGVQTVINGLLTNERGMGLAEYCGLKDSVDAAASGKSNENVGWLELDNGFFMFNEAQMFEATKRLLSIS